MRGKGTGRVREGHGKGVGRAQEGHRKGAGRTRVAFHVFLRILVYVKLLIIGTVRCR